MIYLLEKYKFNFTLERHTLSFPFIIIQIVPIVFFDLFIEIYHHLCFPLYGIPLVIREKYIKIDRYKLSYLTPMEKVFCAYCGYANGFLRYAAAIASATEKYWCAIKHARTPGFIEPIHHNEFAEYGDESGYQKWHDHRISGDIKVTED